MDAMATRLAKVVVVFLFLCLLHIADTSSRLMITIRSSCTDTIWPAIVSKLHSPELSFENMTGFALRTGESKTVSAPDNWAGTVWSRTYCKINPAGKFTCGTGDCGSYAVECLGGRGASVTAANTLVDFTLNGGVGEYTYSGSPAKGFNLPVTVAPGGVESRSNSCKATGCDADLNKECAKEVQVVLGNNNSIIIGCNSACEAFKESQDHYCGRSSTYSDRFKGLCPNAQAFENDKTSNTTFECSSADYYDVHFCASSFPSTPPISKLLRTSSSDGYEDIPGGQVLTDDSSTSSRPVVKIVIGILSPLGAGLLSYLGYFLWRRKSGSNICRLFHCKHGPTECRCCNCFNSYNHHRHEQKKTKEGDQDRRKRDKRKKMEEGDQDKRKRDKRKKVEERAPTAASARLHHGSSSSNHKKNGKQRDDVRRGRK